MQVKYTALEKGNRWSIKDIILTIILSVAAMAVLLLVNFVTMFNHTLNLVFAMGIMFFLCSPLFMFAAVKVNKRFIMTVFFAIYTIYSAFSTWYNALILVAALIIIEAFMWKKDSYKTLWKSTLAFCIMGAATVSLSYTTFFFWDDYQAMALGSGMSQAYLDSFYQTYTTPGLVVGVYAFTIACCIAGCILSYFMFKKHFEKTGILS
jgi:energy-coupling factor transport system substrate-specific component